MKQRSYEVSSAVIPKDINCGIFNKAFQADNTTAGDTNEKWKPSLPETQGTGDKKCEKAGLETSDNADGIFCGIGSCRPAVMQGCKNMACFSAIYSMVGLVTSALMSYINSQITTLEKHFNLSSSLSGFLMSCNDIGYLVTTLFMSYYARRVHIPRALAACAFLYGISGMLCSMAYFVTKDQLPKLPNDNDLGRNQSLKSRPGFAQTCQNFDTDSSCQDSSKGSKASVDLAEEWRTIGIVIIACGMIVQGIAKSPRQSYLGTYVDDNVPRTKTSLYLGIMTGMSIFGPAVAYALGGVFSSMYITLEETTITSRDPRWLGAWWLGFLIFGIAGIITGIPLICFPKRMLIQKSLEAIKQKSKVDKTGLTKLWHDFKGLLKSIWRLTINPVFLCLMIAQGLNSMSISGFMAFIPKYFETQFTLTAAKANILLGTTQVIAAPIGTMFGGYLTSRLKLSPVACLKMMVVVKILTNACSCVGFVLGCNQPIVLTGLQENSSSTQAVSQCVQDCHCNSKSYFPICGDDGNSYFSPCHAGCQGENHQIFTNCTCMATQDTQTATGGLCTQECPFFYPYLALFFIGALVSTTVIMPHFIVMVRCVKEEDKPLAIGLNAFAGTLLGWLPGPVIYGAIVDSTCLLWKTTCTSTGACALYDIELFRFRFHMVSVGLRLIVIFLCIIALIYAMCSKKTVFQPHKDEVSIIVNGNAEAGSELGGNANSEMKEKKADGS